MIRIVAKAVTLALAVLAAVAFPLPREMKKHGAVELLQTFEKEGQHTTASLGEDVIASAMNSTSHYTHWASPTGRMLYSHEQQVEIYQLIYNEKDSKRIRDISKELLEEPDTCDTMGNFMGLVFDSAASLLAYGAGTKHDGMRAFQQVFHMRAVLANVLIETDRPLNESMDSDICIDKCFVALYGWVRGRLLAEAKEQGTLKDKVDEPTDEQAASLKAKKNICTTTTMDEALEKVDVRPVAGEDYPA